MVLFKHLQVLAGDREHSVSPHLMWKKAVEERQRRSRLRVSTSAPNALLSMKTGSLRLFRNTISYSGCLCSYSGWEMRVFQF